MNKSLCLILLYCLCNVIVVQGKIIKQNLYVNSSNFTTVDKKVFPMWCFNKTNQFNATNATIDIAPADTLIVTVTNNDTRNHGFALKSYDIATKIILPNAIIIDTIISLSEKIIIYYDPLDAPNNRYMGLAGMVCVSKPSAAKLFYWNLKEHETNYSKDIADNKNVNWKQYYPDYFTINGLSHPDLQNDVSARVVGKVGETIRIFVANTGQSKHSIHFHGFHATVISSSHKIMQVNSSKDSFPLMSMESAILEFVPDKVGEYSVHDHNLVAISGGGLHPNGMFIIMKID